MRTALSVGAFSLLLLAWSALLHADKATKATPWTPEGPWVQVGTETLLQVLRQAPNRYLLQRVYRRNAPFAGSQQLAQVIHFPQAAKPYIGRSFRLYGQARAGRWGRFGRLWLTQGKGGSMLLHTPRGRARRYKRLNKGYPKGPRYDVRGLWKEQRHGRLLWIEPLGKLRYVVKEASHKAKYHRQGEPIAQFHRSLRSPNHYTGRHRWGSSKVGGKTYWGRMGGFALEQWSQHKLKIVYTDSPNPRGWVFRRYSSLRRRK